MICLVLRTVDKKQHHDTHLVFCLLVPVHDYNFSKFLWQRSRCRQHQVNSAIIMWVLGLAGPPSESPPPLCKTLVGKGASSLLGAFRHSTVLLDEQPAIKNVRAKALRSLAASRRLLLVQRV